MTTQIFKTAEGTLAYDEAGSGPLALLVPGMGDVRGEYRYLAPQLAAGGWRAVSVDVRGHGETSTGWADYSVAGVGADLLALIRGLNAGPAVVVGTSMGAGAAVWAAAEAPDLVRALVLVGPFVSGAPGRLGRLVSSLMFARPWGPALWLAYYATLYPSQKPADFSAYRAALQRNLAEPGRLEALRQMLLASKLASEQRLDKVRAPALVLMGSRDPDFKSPEAQARWVAESVHGRYEMVAGAGHYPHAELPLVAGPRILAFLASLNGPPVAGGQAA